MDKIALWLAHSRGEHAIAPGKACPACEETGAADRPQGVTKDRKRPRKRPKQGTCEHCGCPTSGGRFAPGHDAKLKRDLVREARGGIADAAAELWLRGWMPLVRDSLPKFVITAGADRANEAGYHLVHTRNAVRRQRASTT